MKRHHVLALTAAAICDVALVVDTAFVVVTGERTFLTDDSKGGLPAVLVSSAALGVTFALMGLVVHRERDRFGGAGRLVRMIRPALLGGLWFLAAGFVSVYPLQAVLGIDEGAFYDASGLVAFAALCTVFLSSLVLGLALLRRNPLGIGGRILALMIPVIVGTVIVGLVAPAVASPIYCTMVVLTGVALLGVRAEPTGQLEMRSATASPTAAV